MSTEFSLPFLVCRSFICHLFVLADNFPQEIGQANYLCVRPTTSNMGEEKPELIFCALILKMMKKAVKTKFQVPRLPKQWPRHQEIKTPSNAEQTIVWAGY